MAERLVIGLFQSSGIALDAVHRLVTEGVSSSDIAQRVLKEVGAAPALETDLASMLLDPLSVGNARETFAHHIRNGETAVFVRAGSGRRASRIRQRYPEALPPDND